MTGCVRVGDYFYGFDDTTLTCMDAKTGKVKWAERSYGKGTVLGTGDDRLIVSSDDGRLLVVKATPDRFTKLAEIEVLDTRNNWIVPTLSNGLLYHRSPERAPQVCLDVSKQVKIRTIHTD